MAYTKQNFEDNGVLYAFHLNNMEDGIVSKQDIENLTTIIDENSDDTHYPSAKATYELFNECKEEAYNSVAEETQRAMEAEHLLDGRLNTLESIDYDVYQSKIDNSLETADKTIIGAINELNRTASQIVVTYAELKALRDTLRLIPGQPYRITDYQCTTTQENTRAMNNKFDIVVWALSSNALSEVAAIDYHYEDGVMDGYFIGCNLAAWEIKYSLDNNINRFTWADEVNGKGVIYYMKDHRENEFGYDFTNITYKGSALSGCSQLGLDEEEYYSTFTRSSLIEYSQWGKTYNVARNSDLDQTLDGVSYYGYSCSSVPGAWETANFYIIDEQISSTSSMYQIVDGVVSLINRGGTLVIHDSLIVPFREKLIVNNKLSVAGLCRYGEYTVDYGDYTLPFIVFVADKCYNNVFGSDCYNNTFGSCNNNIFGNYCYRNILADACDGNIFGNNCTDNIFISSCYANTFGDSCTNNRFVHYCYRNIFGNFCYNNTFGSNCFYNIFNSNCSSNTYADYCCNNTFGNNCSQNIFGSECDANTLGNNCYSNIFGNYFRNNILEHNNYYLQIGNLDTTADNTVRNIKICGGVSGVHSNHKFTITPPLNSDVQIIYRASGAQEIILDII